MPKLRKETSKYDKLMVLINGRIKTDRVSMETLARYMGVSRNTATARLREPQNFTLEELGKLSRGLGIPIDEIRAAIPN